MSRFLTICVFPQSAQLYNTKYLTSLVEEKDDDCNYVIGDPADEKLWKPVGRGADALPQNTHMNRTDILPLSYSSKPRACLFTTRISF